MSKVFKRVAAFFGLIGLELAILTGVGFGCVLVFLLMAKFVFIDENQDFDIAAFAFARRYTSSDFTSFMKFVTFFASKDFLIYSSLGLSAFFMFFRSHQWYSIKVPVIAAGSALLNQVLKAWFNRPRPDSAFYEQSGLSFPSGHAMIGGAFYGLLIYLIWKNVRSVTWRLILSGLLVIWILMIGFSRVYLNVHYASDVIAGWSAGFVFLLFTEGLLHKLEPNYARKANELIEDNQNPSTP